LGVIVVLAAVAAILGAIFLASLMTIAVTNRCEENDPLFNTAIFVLPPMTGVLLAIIILGLIGLMTSSL